MKRKTRLRYWRQQRLLTQKELAERSRVSELTISNIERGTPPRFSTVRKLAEKLGIAPEEMYTTEDDPDADRPAVNRRAA